MKLSEIYERAAEHIFTEDTRFTCCAIDAAVRKSLQKAGAMQHTRQAKDWALFWGEELPEWTGSDNDAMTRLQGAFENSVYEGCDRKEVRVLALLFAAAIARSEGN